MSESEPRVGDVIFVYVQGREKWGGACVSWWRRCRGGAAGNSARDLEYRGRGKIKK